METLTNPNRYAPAPGGHGWQSFFGVVLAGFLALFLASVLYFTYLTDSSSPQVTSPERVENTPAVQDTRVAASVTGPTLGTTTNLASHAMFAPLLGQRPGSAPFIFR